MSCKVVGCILKKYKGVTASQAPPSVPPSQRIVAPSPSVLPTAPLLAPPPLLNVTPALLLEPRVSAAILIDNDTPSKPIAGQPYLRFTSHLTLIYTEALAREYKLEQAKAKIDAEQLASSKQAAQKAHRVRMEARLLRT